MTTTPPDWYPDPAAPTAQRWWDGIQWTNYTRATPVPGAPTSFQLTSPLAAYSPASPVKKQATSMRLKRLNLIGFIGVVVALVSVLWDFLGIVALAGIVLTIIGLVKDRKLRKSGEIRTGRIWLIFGLIAASIMFIIRGFFEVLGVLYATGVPL